MHSEPTPLINRDKGVDSSDDENTEERALEFIQKSNQTTRECQQKKITEDDEEEYDEKTDEGSDKNEEDLIEESTPQVI